MHILFIHCLSTGVIPSSHGVGLKSALKVISRGGNTSATLKMPHLASHTSLARLRTSWLNTISDGSMLKKYSDRYVRGVCVGVVSLSVTLSIVRLFIFQ